MDVKGLSLDEIIEINKKSARSKAASASSPNGRARATQKGPVAVARRNQLRQLRDQPKQIRDARDIICYKTRSKIIDARDRLNELLRRTDVRDRLRERANAADRQAAINDTGVGNSRTGRGRRRSRSVSVEHVPRGSNPWIRRPLTCYMDVEDGIDLTNGVYIPPKLNPPMPPLPHFRTVRQEIDPSLPTHCSSSPVDLPWSDPFNSYERLRRQMHAPPAPPPVGGLMPYESASMAPRQPRGILRNRSRSPPLVDHLQLSPSMRARLQRAPNPAESMGIFAKLHSTHAPYKPTTIPSKAAPSKSTPGPASVVYRGSAATPPSQPTTGYRIVVSNLHSKVVHQDIEELFEDIGDLIEARLVRPGVAEVIYRNLSDAEKAVDAYHNRQLDGQPMNCLLVHPRASNKPTAPAAMFAIR